MNAISISDRRTTVFTGEARLSNGYTVTSIDRAKDDTNPQMSVHARDPKGKSVRFVFDPQKNKENGGLALIPTELVSSFFPGIHDSANIGKELQRLVPCELALSS